jgi:hypothetical protein
VKRRGVGVIKRKFCVLYYNFCYYNICQEDVPTKKGLAQDDEVDEVVTPSNKLQVMPRKTLKKLLTLPQTILVMQLEGRKSLQFKELKISKKSWEAWPTM